MLVAVCACGFGGLPRPAPTMTYAGFGGMPHPAVRIQKGALLKPPFSGSVLRKAFVSKGGSKNKTFVGSLPASCGRAHCYYQTFSGAWPHAKSGLVTLKFS